MMTLSESVKILNLFFNKFCPAYINDIIPNNAIFPYLTYSVEIPNFEEEGNIVVRIYNKGSGLIPLFEIADLINLEIREEGTVIGNEEGMIYLTKGSPFCQVVTDDLNNTSLYINLTIQVA